MVHAKMAKTRPKKVNKKNIFVYIQQWPLIPLLMN